MSHDELVKAAENWLMKTRNCSFAFTELKCLRTSEIADAIGFRDGTSILVECKATRADFLADRRKSFRRRPQDGMGSYRFYLCPEGVIKPEDLPERWGLIWATPRGKARQIVGPRSNAWSVSGRDFIFADRNIEAEWGLMESALRRLHLRGVLPLIYDNPFAPTNSPEPVTTGLDNCTTEFMEA